MKKIVGILIVLLAIQSYGIFGAMQADRIMYNCTLEAGPLCYQWEENSVGKLLGKDKAEQLEEKLKGAKKAWEEDFIDGFVKGKDKNSLDSVFKRAGELADDGFKAVKKAAHQAAQKALDETK